MLHTKFQGNWPSGSRENDHLTIITFSHLMLASYQIYYHDYSLVVLCFSFFKIDL